MKHSKANTKEQSPQSVGHETFKKNINHVFTNNEGKILKWSGIKNSDTKETTGGDLWIKFEKDCTLINVNPNVIGARPFNYKAGQVIGFPTPRAKNRKEGISIFSLSYQVIH